jgi:hypothetical protein
MVLRSNYDHNSLIDTRGGRAAYGVMAVSTPITTVVATVATAVMPAWRQLAFTRPG